MREVVVAIRDFVMTWLDPVGIVIGLGVAVPVFWTWYEVVFGRGWRRRRWYREIRTRPGDRPAILIVDLLAEKDIRASVEQFRQYHELLREVPEDRVFVLRRNKHIGPDDMPRLADDIREAAASLMASGADSIHFFYAGPAAVAALVGAELANVARVLVYQHGATGYQCLGPLRGEVS